MALLGDGNLGGARPDPFAPFYPAYGIDASHPAVAFAQQLLSENSLLDPTVDELWTPSTALDQAAAIFKIGPYADTPSPAPAGRTLFPEERESLTAQSELARAQAGALETPEERAARDAADRELEERLNKLNILNSIVNQFSQEQAQARDVLVNITNPFAFQNALMDFPTLGLTPQEAFRESTEAFANQPTPTVNPNASIEELNAQIAGLSNRPSAPTQPTLFGLAHGGTIDMRGGSVTPQEAFSFLVGENPDGTINETTEVVTVMPGFGARVTPLKGRAADGATFNESVFNPQTTLGAFAPIFPELGFNRIPTVSDAFRASELRNLGIQPRLARVGNQFFFRDAMGDFLEASEPFLRANFGDIDSPGRILNVLNLDELRRLGGVRFGTTGISAQRALEALPLTTGFPAPGSLFSRAFEVGGAPLFAPGRAAGTLNELRLRDPGTFNLIDLGFQSQGAPPGFLQSAVLAPFPTGVERRVIGLR